LIRRGSLVRIQPGPPHGLTSWGISSAGRAPALQAGGRRFDPDILHHTLRSVGWANTVHWVADPSGCRSDGHFGLPRKWLLFFNNSWISESSSLMESLAGVKARRTPCHQRYYDCVNRYSSSKYESTTNLKGKRVNTQTSSIQTILQSLTMPA
jgi:hypothetical protein